MEISVLFFGATAAAVGNREIKLDIDPDQTLADVLRLVKTDHAPLAHLKLLSAVNEEYAEQDRRLVSGDKVALFTAVSGG